LRGFRAAAGVKVNYQKVYFLIVAKREKFYSQPAWLVKISIKSREKTGKFRKKSVQIEPAERVKVYYQKVYILIAAKTWGERRILSSMMQPRTKGRLML